MDPGHSLDRRAPDPHTLRGRREIARADAQTPYHERRREVIDIAARLFRDKGYEATRLADIAREFGTDRASLYYYVTGKDELFQEVVGDILDGNVAEAERILASHTDATDKLRRLIFDQIKTQERNYPHMYVYIQDGMRSVKDQESDWARRMSAQTAQYERVARQVLADGVEEGSIRSDIDVRLLAANLFGMLNWPHRWFRPGDPFDADEVATSIASVFLSGAST